MSDMNNEQYTSLELSKKLADNGCDYLEPSMYWQIKPFNTKLVDKMYNNLLVDAYYPAYDLIWDICVKYSPEFFRVGNNRFYQRQMECNTGIILKLLQQNKKNEAELYIWTNTIFNKNK